MMSVSRRLSTGIWPGSLWMSESCPRIDMKDYETQRESMVERQIRGRGVNNQRVLETMKKVPRHDFVPNKSVSQAYMDRPLSIGNGQTISQPYMVALMSECLDPQASERVLEIGTGSGYQTAILAELSREVYSVERIPELAEGARRMLKQIGYRNISVYEGDGSLGLPEEAPFDCIIVAAGAPEVPEPLLDQLGMGGRLVVPIGDAHHQNLYTFVRDSKGIHKKAGTGCVFVPLIGSYGWGEA